MVKGIIIRMRLSTTIPFDRGFDIPRFLKLYQKLGCSTGQYFRRQNTSDNPDTVKQLIENTGMSIDSIHGLMGASLNPASLDLHIREHAINIYKKEAELAVFLGGPKVVVHPACRIPEEFADDNRYPDLSNHNAQRHASHVLTDLHLPPLMQSMKELAKIGEATNVTFLIENIPTGFWIGFDAIALATWIREIASPYLRMCFDTGHANTESDWNGSVQTQLDACIDVIEYVHINDNLGDKDSHLMPGDGTIEWDTLAKILAQGPKDLICMLELFQSEDEIEQRINTTNFADQLKQWFPHD